MDIRFDCFAAKPAVTASNTGLYRMADNAAGMNLSDIMELINGIIWRLIILLSIRLYKRLRGQRSRLVAKQFLPPVRGVAQLR